MSRIRKSTAVRDLESFLDREGFPARIEKRRKHYAIVDDNHLISIFSYASSSTGGLRGTRNIEAAVRRHYREKLQ